MFQIARGSGATLSECTFFFKKAHVTKKTFSKQTTSRPHDKKNPDRAISEIKNPVYAREPFNKESEQFQDEILQLLVPNSKRLGGYTQIEVLFFFKKAHTTRRSQETLHGFTQESTRATLVPARQDLEEQDKASRAQP